MDKRNNKKLLDERQNTKILNNKNSRNIKLKSPRIENTRYNIKLDKYRIKKENFKRRLKTNKLNIQLNIIENNEKDVYKNNNSNISTNTKSNKNTSINLSEQVINKKDSNNLQNKISSKNNNKVSYTIKKKKYYNNIQDKDKIKEISIFADEKLNELEEENKQKDNSVKTKKKYQRLKFKEDKPDIDSLNLENLDIDIKNANIEKKQIKYRFKQKKIYNRLKKKDTIKIGIEREPIYNKENDSYDDIKKKINIKLEKEIRYNKSVPERLKNSSIDLARYKIRQKLRENEEDNSSVKAFNRLGFFVERKFINRLRSSNDRKILKYKNIDKKIEKLEDKKSLNSLKKEYKDDKKTYRKAYKNLKQQKKLNKKMQRKALNKSNINKSKNIINITKIVNKIINALLSFKAIVVSIVLGIVLGFIGFGVALFILLASSGVGNVYEIQKAELYYRELEAKAEFYDNKYIDHDPIHLASFLSCLFGEFVFDENIQNFLDELIKRQYEGKSLDQLVSDSLIKEEYEMWQQLNITKLNLIKYGSPFEFEYESYITSYIGYRINPTSSITELQLHKGLDIGVAGGTPILAISDGIVTRANFSSSYGNIVEIRHEDGYLSKYAHQSKLNVVKGQKVKKGDVIGFVGTTGDSTGNHLHLELYDENGEFMNPIFFIERGGSKENE